MRNELRDLRRLTVVLPKCRSAGVLTRSSDAGRWEPNWPQSAWVFFAPE